MRTRNLMFGLLVLLVLILLVVNVSALGITPGRMSFDYEPGARKDVGFKVINSDQKEMDMVVIVQGELKDHITISDEVFELKANDAEKSLSYSFTMPNDLKPGMHSADIVAVQLPDQWTSLSEASVGASLAVATQLHIFVPYPGKYAEASLNVIGGGGKTTTFVIPVVSKGALDLPSVVAEIEIYNSLDKKIASLTTNTVSIPSDGRKELFVEWDSNVVPGTYRAVATVVYDEGTIDLEREFNVGSATLEVKSIEINDFSLGEIAKFEMLIENKWSETISGAYAQMLVYNDKGAVMADFKSPSYDISALGTQMMISFWDTKGVKEGNYDSSLVLKYGDKSVQEDFKLDVSKHAINVIGVGYVISKGGDSDGGGNGLIMILIVVIVVLILVNLLWFLKFRKKLGK